MADVELGLSGLAISNSQRALELGLRPEYFLDLRCRRVWEIILHDPDTDFTEADITKTLILDDPQEQVNLRGFVADALLAHTPRGAEQPHAELVRNEYIRRRVRSTVYDAGITATDTDDLGAVVQSTVEKLEEIINLGKCERPSLLDEVKEEIREIASGDGLPAGLPSGVGLEKVVPGGIPRDKVTVLFGETGTFKSTLKCNIIDAIACSGAGLVLDFSLEDNNELTRQRALARASGVPYSCFATRNFSPEQLEAINTADRTLLKAYKNVVVIGDAVPTADEIIRTARQYRNQGLVAVVIDYLTMLDWGNLQEREMINHAMVKFQRAAKRDKVAYIVVSQVNEEKIHGDPRRQDKRPQLRDLFGSSAIKNACKLAVAVYRPSKFGPPSTRNDKSIYGELESTNPDKYGQVIELIVRKNILGDSDIAVKVLCQVETGKMEVYES